MKKILFILIFVLAVCSCADTNEQTERAEPDADIRFDDNRFLNLVPVIDGFHGELFSDADNITAGGYYSGFERLDRFGSMIYCNDDGAVIWSDVNGTVFRLSPQGEKEKICPAQECRNEPYNKCAHIHLYNSVYSNGFLYFTVSDFNSAVYRYNVENYELAKLIEFKNLQFCNLALNGRYLYIQTYNWAPTDVYVSEYHLKQKIDYTVTKIDLFTETAAVIYSDLLNLNDFEKIGELKDWRFIDSRIVMPKIDEEKIWDIDVHPARWQILRVGSSINTATLDMNNFETPLEMETERILFDFGGDLKIYDGEIYFAAAESGLNRVDPVTGSREILNLHIRQFDIDGDFLYYINDDDSALYRVLLDYTREINFNTTVEVYSEYNLFNWRVYGGYLYADLMEALEVAEGMYNNNSTGRYRIKLNSQEKPFLFY